jgi:enterochelin esterase family protein
VYVTDGHEYAADYLGSMTIVMDNLIADGRMRPAIAVFIDPRDPEPPHTNRRQTEYVGNRQYAAFLADELVPRIDADYETDGQPSARAILGTSLGGLNSMYVGIVEHDTFGLLGIQSPAFQMYPAIYDLVRDHPHRDQTIFMSAGTLGNDNAAATTMWQILQNHNYAFQYLEVPEGHSWGSWRGQLDSLLVATIGPPVPEPHCSLWLLAIIATCRRRAGAQALSAAGR